MKYTRSGRKKSNRRTRKVLTHLPTPLFRSIRKAQQQHGGGVIWQTFGEYIVESIVGVGNDGRGAGTNGRAPGGLSFVVPTRVNSNGLIPTETSSSGLRIGETMIVYRGLDTSGNGPFYKNLGSTEYNTRSMNTGFNPDKVKLEPTAGGTVTIQVARNLSYVPGNFVLVYRNDDAQNTKFTGKVTSYDAGLGILVIGEIANVKGSHNSLYNYEIQASQPYTPKPTLYSPLRIAVDSVGNIFIIEDANGNATSFRMYSTANKTMTSYGRYVGQLGASNNPGNGGLANFAVYRNEALTVDKKSDTVFIADWSHHSLRSITQDNKLSISGKASNAENGGIYNFLNTNKNNNIDGNQDSAGLMNPKSIAIDPTIGRGYVCDSKFLMMIDMKYPGNLAMPTGDRYYFSRLWTPPGLIHDMVVDNSGNLFALCSNSVEPLGKKRHAVWKIVPPPLGNTNKYNRTSSSGDAILDQSPLPAPPAGQPALVKPVIFAGDETTADYNDGDGTAARFRHPMGISVDSKNNLYIADAGNNVIRCITPQQKVFTLAGTGANEDLGGVSGDMTIGDGASTDANFSVPVSVAVDSSDNVYVLDRGLYGLTQTPDTGATAPLADSAYTRIRKITRIPAPGAPAEFTLVSVDPISATFSWTGALTGFENKGFTAFFQFLIKPSATSAEVSYAVDGATPYNPANRAATASKFITDNASSSTQQGFYFNNIITVPLVPNTSYASIKLVAFNNSGQNASAALTTVVTPPAATNYTIFKSGGAGGFANGPAQSSKFTNPRGLVADATNTLYVADANNHCIRKIDPTGRSTTFFGTPGAAGSSLTTLNTPMDITFSNGGGWPMYIADNGNNRVLSVTSAGVATLFGSSGTTLNTPCGITVDPTNTVYVASNGQHCVYMINSAGVIGLLAGSPGAAGSTDGAAAAATFNGLMGIHYDTKNACLYVADTNNHLIRKIVLSSPVTVYTLAGKAGSAASTNGLGSVGRFYGPTGVTTDSNGVLYVCDYNNHMIRKVNPAGMVSTYSGKGGAGSVNGSTTPTSYSINTSTTTYNAPHGICSGAAGLMFLSEIGNQCIRVLSPYPAPTAPTSVSLSAVTKNSVTLSWSGDSGATSYSFSISPTSDSVVIPTVAVGTSTATFTGLTESTEYSIALILNNEVGSTFSPSLRCVTMIDGSLIKLETPTTKGFSLRGTPSRILTGTLSWTGLTRVPLIRYILRPSAASGASGASASAPASTLMGIMPANQRSPFTIAGLESNTTYSVKITGILPNFLTPTTGAKPPVNVSHIRFTVRQAVGGTSNDYAVASFSIMNGTSVIAWPAGTRVYPVAVGTTRELSVSNPADGGPQNLLNASNTIGKYFPWYPRGTGSVSPAAVIFALGTPTAFTGYRFGAADAVSRTPNRWTLEYSTDGVSFTPVDDRSAANQTMPTTTNTYTTVYPLQIPDTAESNEVTFTTPAPEILYIGTIAGISTATPAVTTATATPSNPLTTQLNTIRAIAQDDDGNIYVSSVTCILKLSPPATRPTLYAFDTTLARPTPIPIPNTVNGLAGYTVSLFAGSTTQGAPSWTTQTGSAIRFQNITAMLYSKKQQCLYVSEQAQAVIVKVTLSGTPTATVIAGTVGWGAGQDGAPRTNKITVPKGLAEGPDGTLFFCDFNYGVRRIDITTGNVSTISGIANDRPNDLVVYPDGSLYYSSGYDHTIRKLTPNPADPGKYINTIFAGASQPTWSSGVYVDGPLLTARFNGPQGLAVDSNYNMYVYDSNNYAIRLITGGNVYTIMGGTPPNPSPSGNTDGVIANARVKGDPGSQSSAQPYTALFSSPSGTLYLPDYGNGTLRLISNFPASQVITQTQLDYYKTSGAQASSALAQRSSSAIFQAISGAQTSSAVAQVASQAVASSAIQLSALSGPVLAKDGVVSKFQAIKADLAAQIAVIYSASSSSTAKTAATSALRTRLGDLQTWLQNLAATAGPILAVAPMYQDRAVQPPVRNPYLESIGSTKLYDIMRKAYITIDSTTGYMIPNIEIPSRRPFVTAQKGATPSGAQLNVWSAPLSTDILLSGDLTLPSPSIWTSYFDTAARRYFYVNTSNNTSQYEHPFSPVLSSGDQILTDTTTNFLPVGWMKLQNTAKNLPYYLNVQTTETSWEHPAPPPNPNTSTLAIDASLFPAYKKYISTTAPTSGKAFYVNSVTKEAQWDFPDSAFNVGPSTAQQASSSLAQRISGAQASSATAQGASSAVAQTVSSALAQRISGAQASSATAQGASSAVAQTVSSALAQSISGARASSALAQSISGARASSATAQLASSAVAQTVSSALAQSISGARASSATAQVASSALAQRISGAQASSSVAQIASSAVQQRDSGAQQQAASSAVQQRDSSAKQQTALSEVVAIKDSIKNQMKEIQLTIRTLIDATNGKGPSTSVANIPLEIQTNLFKLAEKKTELLTMAPRIFELSPEYQDSELQTIVKDDTLSGFRIKKVFDTLRNGYLFLDANDAIVQSPLTPAIRAYTSGAQYGGGKQKKGSRKSSILLYRI